jgi:predicted AAA+ superfamily ATPase
LVELNFEANPQYASLFSSNDPLEILRALGAALNAPIQPNDCLLFLDEIQAVPQILAKLRWFFEGLPTLPIIAAGSLLEFALTEAEFSMPVGRVSFMYLEPLSFEEFLSALGKEELLAYLMDYELNKPMPKALHEQALALFKDYVLVGGMPAAVASWVQESSLPQIGAVHSDLLATYRADFAKYRGRVPLARLEEVFVAVPRLLGQKFIFSHVNAEVHTGVLKQALTLLTQAGICHTVYSTAANGIPLAAEKNEKFFKVIYMDIGLTSSALGLGYETLRDSRDLTLVNRGAIAEQVVGQLLRTLRPPYAKPELFYWHRSEKGSQAEVDYIAEHAGKVLPIEVKAGTAGRLKSLVLFMKEKNLSSAVKISSAPPMVANDPFTLFSVPFYLCGQLARLVDQA